MYCIYMLTRASLKMFLRNRQALFFSIFMPLVIMVIFGSMNFDNRSMAFNNESNLVFLDATLGAEMNATFMADLGHAREIKLDEFQRRGRWERLLEGVAATMSRLL